ncbi:toll/interleukin-1 receptor domain-containing protein [Clavibacter zhangzhiyongii]|uniref:Toll/interleukin-1 receptor domain-containing protein n=1 Tax=Clavibacter zhangzhiyongii TaxID=2768071 RepID=A0A7L7YYJ7_9MICO|nr:toll/interleukin-1 receptor domain-containing protein [Clavibacter zhangzhiyongii]QOD42540.1 toll/interleukin-1 receptor domain-containing protein [Clavibacter zhangzhiyongii]
MQVFISWSGPQANAVAEGLKDWLPRVLARTVSCFVSSSDIESGQRGLNVIAQQLEQCEFGIVVVTPDNLEKPWINFEAGALSKAFKDHAQVTPLLVGLAEQEVKPPLSQFQMRSATSKESVLQLVLSVNRAQPDPVDEETVKDLFGLNWSAFQELVAAARATNTDETPRRGTEDILEEVLGTVRGLQRQVDDLRFEVAGPGPIPLSEQKVSDAARRALDYIKMMKLDLKEGLSAHRVGQSLVLQLPASVPDLGPEYIWAFQSLAIGSELVFRLQWDDEHWYEFEPGGRYRTGPDGQLAPRD